MPALVPLLMPVFGVQLSPVGQVVEETSGELVNADTLVGEFEVGDFEVVDFEVEEGELEADDV